MKNNKTSSKVRPYAVTNIINGVEKNTHYFAVSLPLKTKPKNSTTRKYYTLVSTRRLELYVYIINKLKRIKNEIFSELIYYRREIFIYPDL